MDPAPDEELGHYLEDVAVHGFPLGLLTRTLAVLKACAYGAVMVLVGMLGTMFWRAGMGLLDGMGTLGVITLGFSVLVWLIAIYCGLMGLIQVLAALTGRMPVSHRAASDTAERL